MHRRDEPLQNRRTVFVSSDKGARELDEAGQLGTTPAEVAAAPPLRSMQRSKRARAALELGASANPTSSSAADEGEAADNEASEQPSATASATVAPPKLSKKLRAKLDRAKAATYSELEQRVERHKQMGRTLHRIGIEKALLGKGPRRKLKSKEEGAPKQYKFKQRRKK
uniref:Uncharacterized protein n=1 Tax=Haptolina brevifila TaxID=156173 RepID=A0A7S2FPW7_9EUKA